MADITTVVTSFPTDYASAALVNANTPFTLCYGTVSVTSGQLNVLCDTTFNHGGKTAENYTWNGTGFYFKPTAAPKGGASTAQHSYYAFFDASSTDDSIRAEFDINTGPATPTITAVVYSTDNTYTDVGTPVSATYVQASTHTWLGFYYDVTNLYFVRSSDGNTWVTFRTVALSLATWLTTQSDLGFVSATNRTGGSNTTSLLDNVNTGGTAPGAVAGTASPQPILGRPSNPVLSSFSW